MVEDSTAPQQRMGDAPQRVVKVRRDYNSWVGSETMEDYALRFTARSFRKWSEWRVANTAFGAASFLVLEAVGATLLVQYGFASAFWAILCTGLIIFAAGLPISIYAARYGVDMDLLTRGAGFGYIGSTITSLIYASFTFIFFALEAAVMAYALDLAFDIPPAWGYLICALVVIPLVTHGVTMISRLQVWTQPLWLLMLVLPFVYVFHAYPGVLSELSGYGGSHDTPHFNLLGFGAALTVGIALITQMGEQADYLRFMPEPTTPRSRMRWWAGVLVGGPGWVVLGVVKMLAGTLLAYIAISHMVPAERAVDPNQMYVNAWNLVFPHYGWAVAATALFVVISQLKINVTNAYAGSLAWSNFFARLTHSHPGRVVWVVFNTLIALMLMELDVFQALGHVLGLYSNLAISWMMAVVADLVVNKPMGWSPKGIEFKRAFLYDVNPVGVGAMGIASVLSVAAHMGAFGELAQAFSAVIAMVTAFVASPLIAWATGGRYYLARHDGAGPPPPVVPGRRIFRLVPEGGSAGSRPAALAAYGLQRCCICEREYEHPDMAQCPAYQGPICSLCCSLDARCDDLCKPDARLSAQWAALLRKLMPRALWPSIDSGLGHYLMVMLMVVPVLALLFGALYAHELRLLGEAGVAVQPALRLGFVKAFAALLLVSGIVAWWLVLTHKSRQVAQEESNRQTQALHEQTQALQREAESHRRTDAALQEAKRAADAANQAKSRYITTISHELRTPLNSILGYAQLLEEDEAMPEHRKRAVSVIRRGGDHLLSLIEGTLDIARIEGGKFNLSPQPMRFRECVHELSRLFELQAAGKGIAFEPQIADSLPDVVRADEKRLRQILINVLGNAVKFTAQGRVAFRVTWARELARFEIEDSGPGMSDAELERVFEPFMRGSAAGMSASGGTGLGLTIAKMLTDLMGGEMTVKSQLGAGSKFTIRLFLPEMRAALAMPAIVQQRRTGYVGPRRKVLVVDNEELDRGFLASVLEPLGFEVAQAASGEEALARVEGLAPDVILMDLAMPGIDGWETLRRLRAQGLSAAPAAIVSANAFDKGLENDVGIAPEDFMVKPVRVGELLDWLGRRLQLQWIDVSAASSVPRVLEAAPAAPPPDDGGSVPLPPRAQLEELDKLVNLGYVRGIVRKLDEIEAAHAGSARFVARMRALAQGFQLDAMHTAVREGLAMEVSERPGARPADVS
ncbi:ATP-binding protein [Aquincola tertiaricarbonis]|uniref:ATP-binding protein n=1 Tax=Aquincola tertiaricarbonis TaxID=391953 RepID=UPI000614AFC0|nr:ATP-binding protein [Aquincola tertiaricarbonis]